MAAPPLDSGGFQFALAVRAPPAGPWVGAPICTRPGKEAAESEEEAAERLKESEALK